jgi:YHS domain-containing protein
MKNVAWSLPLLFLLGSAPPKEAKCPVSGKPVDPDVSIDVNGQKVHFCCNGCVGSFKKNQLSVVPSDGKCPVSGREGKEEISLLHAEMVYFCCNRCPKKFAAEKKFKPSGKANTKCPITGQPVDEETFTLVNGNKVYFCCGKCQKAYSKKLLHAADKGPQKCVVSGAPAKKETGQLYVREVRFCCDKCRTKYVKEKFPKSSGKKSA